MNILILSPYPPYPPHGGGTMRIFQLVRGLAARHHVTCLTFAPDEATEQALKPLRDVCCVRIVRGPAPRSTARRAATTLVSPLPDMALRNASTVYAAALHALLARETFDVIQAESIEMASYLQGLRAAQRGLSQQIAQSTLLVLDQFNAEFVLQRRAMAASFKALFDTRSRGSNPQSQLLALGGTAYSLVQWQKLARYERSVMRQCDAVIAVSDEDARTLRALQPAARLGVVPNGVDTSAFSRATLARDRVGALVFGDPALVFTGTLDFRPNVDAITWFVREVLPHLRAQRPQIRLVVVGKRPAPVLQQLAQEHAITLVGAVADARPYIASAPVYVVPMRIGGGVRLKLLEAFALEAPVVSTTMGAEGVVGLRDNTHCLIADDPRDFAAAVLRLLDDRALAQRLGAAARVLVQQHYDWTTIVPKLEAIYQVTNDERRTTNDQ